MLKLNHLRSFLVVAEAGSLAVAGARLNRSVSALSMTLRQIEETLGGVLFLGERKTQLTPLGQVVLDQARRAVRAHDSAITEIEDFAQGRAGRVRVATVPSVAATLLPLAVRRFHAKGAVQLDLRDADSHSVIQAVTQGAADIGIATLASTHNNLHAELLITDRLRIVTRVAHPLGLLSRPLDWDDLRPFAFIGNGLSGGLDIGPLRALTADAALFIHNVTGLQAFLEQGDAITLLPELSLGMYPNLQAHHLADPRLTRDLHIIRRRDDLLSPAAQRFNVALLAALTDFQRAGLNTAI